MSIVRVPLAENGGGLFRDYLAGGGGMERRLGRFDLAALTANAARPRQTRDAGTWNELVDVLVRASRGAGATQDALDRLERARAGDTRFVVTGQQPGVLGGPLMTLYKVATAVALAEKIETETGTPTLALYWTGSDDIDFAEIRELVIPAADLTPVTVSLGRVAHEVAMPVGDIAVSAVEAIWKATSPLLAPAPGFDFVRSIVEDAIAACPDHGALSARVISRLMGGRIAVVDGREPALRRHTRDVILSYFDDEDQVRRIVQTEGDALERENLHAQLRLGPDSGVFLIRDGRRQKVSADRRAAVRERFASHIEEAAPGVVLRNLVQDAAFDPVAVVLGPAEIAYRAQIAPLYDHFGLNLPVSIARLFATFVPAEVAAIDGVELVALKDDAHAVLRAVYEGQASPELRDARADFLRRFDDAREAFGKVAGSVTGERIAGKTEKRLDDIRRRLDQATGVHAQAGQSKALERWPFLAHVPDLFERQGKPQERYLSMLAPFLIDGEEAVERVMAAAHLHLEAAMDAQPAHIVYSV